MTTSHTAAEHSELLSRIHQLERDAEDREHLIAHLKARCLALMDQLRDAGVPAVPTAGAKVKG